MKNKNLLIILIILSLVIIGFFVYYLTFYLPKKELLTLQKECLILRDKKSKEYKQEHENDSLDIMSNVDYVFDADSRICAYKELYGVISNSGSFYEKHMYNLFTNKLIASYAETGDGVLINGDKYEYQTLENEYFK